MRQESQHFLQWYMSTLRMEAGGDMDLVTGFNAWITEEHLLFKAVVGLGMVVG